MDRSTFYYGEILRNFDLLSIGQSAMVGLAQLTSAVLGQTGSVAVGLGATPGTGLAVNIAAGQFYQLESLEATALGGGAAGGLTVNTTQILKQGLSLASQTVTGFAAPGTIGQSINYLVEAQYQDLDYGSVVLPYYNAALPSAQYAGPGNSNAAQSYARKGVIAFQVKAGTAATTGTQTTPSADSGWTGLYVVTVAYGASTITGGNIAPLSSAPFLAGLLNSHHSGGAGQAPQIKLGSEVQGTLPMANLLASDTAGTISAVQTYSGNPNGYLAGNAGVTGTSAPSLVYDTSEGVLWVCSATGSTSTAVWIPIVAGYVGVTWCGTSTGSANAQVLTPSPALPANNSAVSLAFIAGFTNTTALTVNVSGLGPLAVYKDGRTGSIPLTGGEIVAGEIYSIRYDGTRFQLTVTELGTSSLKNTGNTVVDPGTGNLESATPATTATGANYTYLTTDRGNLKLRSNSGTAMVDTLPAGTTFPNGWWVEIENADTVGLIVQAPSGTNFNGVSAGSISIPTKQSVVITSDGTNYWATSLPYGAIVGNDYGYGLAYQIGWVQ